MINFTRCSVYISLGKAVDFKTLFQQNASWLVDLKSDQLWRNRQDDRESRDVYGSFQLHFLHLLLSFSLSKHEDELDR